MRKTSLASCAAFLGSMEFVSVACREFQFVDGFMERAVCGLLRVGLRLVGWLVFRTMGQHRRLVWEWHFNVSRGFLCALPGILLLLLLCYISFAASVDF